MVGQHLCVWERLRPRFVLYRLLRWGQSQPFRGDKGKPLLYHEFRLQWVFNPPCFWCLMEVLFWCPRLMHTFGFIPRSSGRGLLCSARDRCVFWCFAPQTRLVSGIFLGQYTAIIEGPCCTHHFCASWSFVLFATRSITLHVTLTGPSSLRAVGISGVFSGGGHPGNLPVAFPLPVPKRIIWGMLSTTVSYSEWPHDTP